MRYILAVAARIRKRTLLTLPVNNQAIDQMKAHIKPHIHAYGHVVPAAAGHTLTRNILVHDI